MCENYWWSTCGKFKPWSQCPTRPDPGEVLLFYLAKREIPPEEHVSFLSDLLDLQKSMVYAILKGEGFDSISRCRILVQALKIHPPLLGIDADYFPIDRHAYWWQDDGYPFDADAQGYPLIGQVIAYWRVQRVQEGGESVKAWSQQDLGDATGFKKETIYRMEHDRNPFILEHMSRRAIVAAALGTVAGDEETTIFRFFGLDPQAYGVPVHVPDPIPEVHFLPSCLTDEVLDEYQQKQATFFHAYATSHAQDRVEEIFEWLRRVEALGFLAETSGQHIHLLTLECRYHELIAAILREKTGNDCIVDHTTVAVTLAERAITLSQGGEHLTLAYELVAAALVFRASTLFEIELYRQAQADIDRVLDLLPKLQSHHLKVRIVAEAGLIHAYTAQSEVDRALVCSYFNQAFNQVAQLNARGQFQPGQEARDEHFMSADPGLLYLYKAMALSAPRMRGTTADTVRDLLETAQKLTAPELSRRHALITVFLALDAYARGDYLQAIEVALDALEKSRQIRSRLKRDRIAELYEHLLNTNARDQPHLSYLGVKLRTWEHGLD